MNVLFLINHILWRMKKCQVRFFCETEQIELIQRAISGLRAISSRHLHFQSLKSMVSKQCNILVLNYRIPYHFPCGIVVSLLPSDPSWKPTFLIPLYAVVFVVFLILFLWKGALSLSLSPPLSLSRFVYLFR